MNFSNLKEWNTPRGKVTELKIDGKITWKSETEAKLGDSVYMNVNGVRTEFIVVHIGNPNTQIYDESCDGVWLMMKDVYPEEMKYSNNTSAAFYKTTDIYFYLKTTFNRLLDFDIQSIVKQAYIPVMEDMKVRTQVFLPSAYELGAYQDTGEDGEPLITIDGSKLDYFKQDSYLSSSNVASNEWRKCYNNGVLTAYPTRSMRYLDYEEEDGEDVDEYRYYYVNTSGAITHRNLRSSNPMVTPRPTMILPYPLKVDGKNNVIGRTPVNIGELTIGSSVYMNVNGVRKEFIVVHQGLPSSVYDSSCDGTWLLLNDEYTTSQYNSGAGNYYPDSTLDQAMDNFIGTLDSGIQELVKEVIVPYHDNSGYHTGSNGTLVKAFALSRGEIGYDTRDGAPLDYFYGAEPMMQRYSQNWWLRSRPTSGTNNAYYCMSSGGATTGSKTTYYYVRPAMILNPSTRFDENFNIIA